MSDSIVDRDAILAKELSWIDNAEIKIATSAFLDEFYSLLQKLESSGESASLVAAATRDKLGDGGLSDSAEQVDRSNWGFNPSDDEKVFPVLSSVGDVLNRLYHVAPSVVVQLRAEKIR